MRQRLQICAAAAAFALIAGCTRAATPCEALVKLQLTHATVTSAALTPAGSVTACKIDVTSRPTADSAIGIEVWIPEGAAWNGRYLQLGNGGFAGRIASDRLGQRAAQGYAVAMTDDGHQSAPGVPDAAWAIGHPEKVTDFGWRALKETTEAAKALIRAHAGLGPKYSYFNGCSDGGREALIEAQRFPRDFDGIVAGAPANDFSGLLTLGAFFEQSLAAPGAWLGPDQLKALETAALADCGGGSYIAAPLSCRFDPGELACPPDKSAASCLTPAQVSAARALYRGLVISEGGRARFSYPGYAPGAEAEPGAWTTWVAGPAADQQSQALIYGFASGFWRGFVYGDAGFDIMRLDLQAAPVEAARVAGIVDSTDPDLGAFRDHGGKLIQFHGWNDPAIPARGSIAYYEEVKDVMGDPSAFYRLYLVPGMLHCGGGRGPSTVDWQSLMQAWVEQGQAPGAVVAGGQGGATQTLSPYVASR
jgi:hypothetical protein